MIEDFFKEEFTIYKRTEEQVKGVNTRSYAVVCIDPDDEPIVPISFYGAFFTPGQIKTVLAGKQDVQVTKTLYCPVDTPIAFGDYVVTATGKKYDVVENPVDTLLLGHHFIVSLSNRI